LCKLGRGCHRKASQRVITQVRPCGAGGAPGAALGVLKSFLRAGSRTENFYTSPCGSATVPSGVFYEGHFENGAVPAESAASLLKEPPSVLYSTLGGNWM